MTNKKTPDKTKTIIIIKIIIASIIIVSSLGAMLYDFFINGDSFKYQIYSILISIFLFAFVFLNHFVKSYKINKNIDDITATKKMKKKSNIILFVSLIITLALSCFVYIFLLKISILFQPVYKPIIYLYPKTETSVNVSLEYKDNIIVSYPEYSDGWNVLAKPNGDLIDLDTGKKLYSLYYENLSAYNFSVKQDGFVVSSDQVADFLDEKLEVLGLNYKEREEFIVYWLPILKANKYNYIRFATSDEIENNMPLTINPTPDSVIRVIMTFKGLEKPIEVTEQKLITPKRTGFVAVEWGGTKLK
ncbi:MAG: hypothetical protein E7254_12190 [Lachnospiraceae bacterium]|nr:hypothetical protein [Lachnospiraceae bacterium]